MKLYVVGEKSANPDDWSIWSEHAIVIAESEGHALIMTDSDASTPVTEIPMDKPLYLVQDTEPSWGDDL